MKNKIVIFCLICCFVQTSCTKEKRDFGTTIEVPTEVETIAEALKLSKKGDTILLQPGVYNERNLTPRHSVLITSLYYLTGDEKDISGTVIGGEGYRRRFFINNVSDTIVLNGFTIEEGLESWDKVNSPTQMNPDNFIGGNYVGGGIYCNNSNLKLNNIVITHNRAIQPNTRGIGGGLYIDSSYISMENVVINNNSALASGGAFQCSYSTLKIYNSNIYNNISTLGCPISIKGSCLDFKNVIIRDNVNDNYGDLDILIGDCTGILDNVTILNDSYEINNSPLTITNSNIEIPE